MSMTVQELADKLDEIAEDNPEAEVMIEPPYSPVHAVYYREDYDKVEITH